MFGYGRRKKVTNQFDDRVKARIVGLDLDEHGCISSGSDRSAQVDEDDDVSLSSFSEIVFSHSENEAGEDPPSDNDPDCVTGVQICSPGDAVEDEIEPILIRGGADAFRNILASHVTEAVELFSRLTNSSKLTLRRRVAAYLRDVGYNAAVCTTKWASSDGITAGDHEFIDVLRSDSNRYIVDLEFSSEFEIARPTDRFELLVRSLPKVFVGKCEDLRIILRLLSEAARRSLKSRGLHLPPWRKRRFMMNKWLGSYRRTTNFAPERTSMDHLGRSLAIKCRSVGFDAAANGRLLFPVVTRTR
ncbi:unnamed protein product [Cuscuta epithymum]|uniref:Uncharacterized protein n=1 Tax=Cuscuta epithymum TaxID=186058 RepID=A0AAV0FTR2_9ASTE|nr:unnamed protein product [Cuscuta epithymum]